MDYEKLGAFYLGRRYDPAASAVTGDPILYDAKDLTTHAVCVGMTGSGKTGLGIALLEDAVATIRTDTTVDDFAYDTLPIAPRKSDLAVERLTLVWIPETTRP